MAAAQQCAGRCSLRSEWVAKLVLYMHDSSSREAYDSPPSQRGAGSQKIVEMAFQCGTKEQMWEPIPLWKLV